MESSRASSPLPSSGSCVSLFPYSACCGTLLGNSKSSPFASSHLSKASASAQKTNSGVSHSAKRMYYPQTYHHIQEIQKYNIQDYRPRMEQFQKAIRKVRQVQRMRKQRGYAFSQADESQTRVLQAYDTTRERGRYGEMASSRASEGGGRGGSARRR